MSTTAILIILIAVAIITLFAVRGGGPRVTQIDRTVKREDPKDSDNA